MNHDLDLFRSIVNELMNEEEKEPVLQPDAPEALFSKLNIHLSEEYKSHQLLKYSFYSNIK